MVARVAEALLGAVWYDTGKSMQAVRAVMGSLNLVQ
jgi:dsRNA-specific ribonuclease